MQSDNKHIDQTDDFSRKIGEKLRQHHLPVDSDVWDSLAAQLVPRKKRISVRWVWAAAGVAAALLAWVFLSVPFSLEEREVEVAQQVSEKAVERQQPETATEKPAEIPSAAPLQAQHLPSEKHAQRAETIPYATPEEAETVPAPETEQNALPLFPEKTEELAEVVPPETETADEPEPPYVEELLAENIVAESSRKRSLIAALGSGDGVPELASGGYYDKSPVYAAPILGGNLYDGTGTEMSNKYNVLAPKDYSHIEHRPPVSLSLMVGFPLSENVSLETGLSYTYLLSRFRRNDALTYRGTLQQHYVGIPLNVRYTVWQNRMWGAYLLGGAGIEKGIHSLYKQEIVYNGGVVHHTNVSSGIRGFQFSAQVGAGVHYRLSNQLNVFAEPRLIYYFHNNQPMSARTENPLVFGLNVGFRWQFE